MSNFIQTVHDILYNDRNIDSTTGCWIYTGGIDTNIGYGRVQIDGIRYHTHRLSAWFHLGLDLEDSKQFACHTCSNRLCMNPMHLYIGDNQNNQLDVSKNTCKKGHLLTPDNVYSYKRKANNGTLRVCKTCSNQRYQDKKLGRVKEG